MENYNDASEVCELNCHQNHIFHVDCLEEWFKSQVDNDASKLVCPVCRTEVNTNKN
jgi:hypothetical protein